MCLCVVSVLWHWRTVNSSKCDITKGAPGPPGNLGLQGEVGQKGKKKHNCYWLTKLIMDTLTTGLFGLDFWNFQFILNQNNRCERCPGPGSFSRPKCAVYYDDTWLTRVYVPSGDRGDTCVQCEAFGPPGLPGLLGPKGEHGEWNWFSWRSLKVRALRICSLPFKYASVWKCSTTTSLLSYSSSFSIHPSSSGRTTWSSWRQRRKGSVRHSRTTWTTCEWNNIYDTSHDIQAGCFTEETWERQRYQNMSLILFFSTWYILLTCAGYSGKSWVAGAAWCCWWAWRHFLSSWSEGRKGSSWFWWFTGAARSEWTARERRPPGWTWPQRRICKFVFMV